MNIIDFEKDVFEAISKLSVYIPEEIVEKEWSIFKQVYRIDGFALAVETDFGNRETVSYAIRKDDMFFIIMNVFLDKIALKLELYNREKEQCNWR